MLWLYDIGVDLNQFYFVFLFPELDAVVDISTEIISLLVRKG